MSDGSASTAAAPGREASKRPASRALAQRAAKARRVQDAFLETEYYFENGLRKVRPYKFAYTTHAKGRWLGFALLDVFIREFRDLTAEYYKDAIESGRITVNGAKASPSYIVRNGDFLAHALHRIEPPVTQQPIEVITRTSEILVVNKPASIPVHPSGRYRHNSIIFILRRELPDAPELFPIHRLDRLTSGVLMLALNKERSVALQQQMLNGDLRKEYLCRVLGEFPADQDVECNAPMAVYNHKLGLNVVTEEGKPCRTVFRRLAWNGRTSLVHCRPYTGRTHQIRVHLQYLGFPIANDPLYAHPAWGPARGKGGVDEKERLCILERFYAMQKRGTYDHEAKGPGSTKQDGSSNQAEGDKVDSKAIDKVEDKADGLTDSDKAKDKTDSTQAGITAPEAEGSSATSKEALAPAAFWASPSAAVSSRPDPPADKMCLWLHAHKYAGPDWEYEAPPPAWANAEFTDDQDIYMASLWDETDGALALGDE